MAKGPANPERSFGVSVGGALLLLSAALVWRGRISTAEVMGSIGAVLLVLGLSAPGLLFWPSKAWWRFAKALGHVNARIILTVAFAIVLTPMSIVWRLTGRDPLARRREKWPGWTPYPKRYADRSHFTRMY